MIDDNDDEIPDAGDEPLDDEDEIDITGAEFFESVRRLTRDLRNASITLSEREVRFLVDAYYAMQRDRIRAAHQNRTLRAGREPHAVLRWLQAQRATLEKQIARALDAYSGGIEIGRWARSQIGVGPIIAAGLAAHIDIEKAPTCGHIWRYAGLDPTVVWEKGQKRPWNGSLKRLCFLIGESFVKVSGNPRAVYGLAYVVRKQREVAKNERGDFADQAAASLAAKNWRNDTFAKAAYLSGKLPPARIHMRSKRWAVKLFLSNYHHVLHEIRYRVPPPLPFILQRDPVLHTHFMGPPGWSGPAPLAAAEPQSPQSELAASRPAGTTESTIAHEPPSRDPEEHRPAEAALSSESTKPRKRKSAEPRMGRATKPKAKPKSRAKAAAPVKAKGRAKKNGRLVAKRPIAKKAGTPKSTVRRKRR